MSIATPKLTYSIAPSSESDTDLPLRREKSLPHVPFYLRAISRFKRGYVGLVRYWWAWEILAATLSITATVALIAVLATHDGVSLQDVSFGTAQLTLNTVVAAISTVIRASLMVTVSGALNQSSWNWFSESRNGRSTGKPLKDLDTFGDAAADSWSSVKLLFRSRGMALASLGAAITILSLAFDTFSQQVLTTDMRNVASDPFDDAPSGSSEKFISAAAFLPQCLTYTYEFAQSPERLADASFFTYGALVSAMTRPSTSPEGVCSTGNCTWPTTPTLGVCSSCTDMKAYLTRVIDGTDITYTLPWPEEFTNPQMDLMNNVLGTPNTNITFRTTTAEFALSTLAHTDPILNLTSDGRFVIALFSMIGITPQDTDTFQTPQAESFTSDEVDALDALITAYQCSFHFCLQAFNATTENGETESQLVTTWDQWQEPLIGAKPQAPFGDDTANYIHAYRVPAEPPETMNIVNASEYRVEWGSLSGLAFALGSLLKGTVRRPLDGNSSEFLFDGFNSSSSSGTSSMQTFWDASDSLEDITDYTKVIADQFTTYMRTALGPTDPHDLIYAPTVFVTQTFVVVRWGWLAFPLGLLVAGHIFLFATILQTQRRSLRPWKGHRVPLLLAGVDEIVKRRARGGYVSRTGLEERVGRMKMRPEYDDGDEIAFRMVP